MKKKKYSVWSNIAFYYKGLYQFSPITVYRQIGGIICGVLLPLFTIYLPKIMLDFVQRKVSGAEFIVGMGGFVLLMASFGALANGVIGGTYMEKFLYQLSAGVAVSEIYQGGLPLCGGREVSGEILGGAQDELGSGECAGTVL